ncbi:MAG: AraC family transcriptional regulator [Butyrivibrio sp.]|jgi:AraC-like DNA-binding protein|nr:AraC family transcriptional regulator [Butyrivibrio sp.]
MQIRTDAAGKEIKKHGEYFFPISVSEETISAYEGGHFLWHWHREIEFTLIISGCMCYRINDRTYHLQEGQALFGNTMVLHSGEMENGHDCRYISVTFDPVMLYGSGQNIIYEKYVAPVLQNPAFDSMWFNGSCTAHENTIRILKKIIQKYGKKAAGYELEINALLMILWKNVLDVSGDAMQEQAHGKNYDRMRSILSFIGENYNNDLTLERIADEVHLCRAECCRMFRKYMKCTLFDYISEYRIRKSLDLLRNADLSVGEIAEAAGFSDANYYAKVFRKYMSCSPSQYREQHRPLP